MAFSFDTTPSLQAPLLRESVWAFTQLCRLRGVDQRGAMLRILRSLQSQLTGLSSLVILTVSWTPGKARPTAYFE
eukprot:885061-Rhodomonas_salina.1